MTFDTHLINQALAALGITTGIAILMAIAITAIAAAQAHRKPSGGTLTAVPADPSAQTAREREPQAA